MLISTGCAVTLGVAGLIALSVFTRAKAQASDRDFNHKLRHDGRTRTYEVHLPPKYDGKTPLPVVLNLHGGGGNATVQRRQSRMDATADQNGFIVVYPEGTSGLGRLYTWNAGICCSYAKNQNVDDVGFIAAILDELPKQYVVDSSRVYATGMSNGAMMCYRLACELSDRITAICGVASTMGVDGPRPKRPVPVMQIHGLKDPNALFAGGIGPNAISRVQHRSVRDVIRWWCEVNHCDLKPAEVSRTTDYEMERYAPPAGQDGAPVVLYMLFEGGHTWPGGVDVTPRLGTGKLIASFSADQTMWDFFRQFSLPDAAARQGAVAPQ